ncbi:Sec-independent protein translocase subunit TatA [Nocardia rhizosphaerihabitans]|uniref:Sec-independent protein translocase subunit TatA n=1 Tax=Nocardia rhizosphaerihabitans TaxID=1691570 RepID=UPI003671CD8D
MGAFSWTHLLIITSLFVVLFGAKRLPDAARGLGRSLRILKSEVGEMQSEPHRPSSDDVIAPQPPQPRPLTATQKGNEAPDSRLDRKAV